MKRNTKSVKESGGKIFEAKADKTTGAKRYPVVIISQGLGNLVDRNYYTSEAIKSGEKVYEGKPAYLNHPTEREEEEQPGRSVKDMCGHYEDCKAVKGEDGLLELRAFLVPVASKHEAIGLIDHSIIYKQKYPDNDFVGISINGAGDGKEMEYEDFLKDVKPKESEMSKISQIEGKTVNVISKFTEGVSADLVTAAGARGRVLKESLIKRRKSMFNWIKKYLKAAETGDKKLMAEAVKHLALEGKKEKKEKSHEAEAGALAKHVIACKQGMEKKEGESEEAYEARVLAAAMKKAKSEAEDEAKKKEKGDKKVPPPEDDEDDAEESEDEDSEDEEESEDEAESEDSEDEDEDEDEEESEGDDEDHADAPQDKKLIKKMMKQMKGMKSEIEALKSAKKEAQKESAQHKIKSSTKERVKDIDTELAKSGLRRKDTEHLYKLFTENNFTKEERKQMIEAAVKMVDEARDEETTRLFSMTESGGFPEVNPSNDDASNNDAVFNKKEE